MWADGQIFQLSKHFSHPNTLWSLESLVSRVFDANCQLNSPTGQQTTKHDGLYPLLSVLLTVPPFVERFQQRDDPCHGFYTLVFLSFLQIP